MAIFDIGKSALLASQRALTTTGNNIANAATPGYSRQSVSFFEREPTFVGAGFVGNGVNVSAISRAYDSIANARVNAATSGSAQQSQLLDLGLQIDNILAAQDSGLDGSLNRFFNALGDFSTDPTSTAVRSSVLNEARALEQSFNSLSSRFVEFRRLTESGARNTVNEINERTRAIAALNTELQQSTENQSPSLLDQRDQQLRELSELVGINVQEVNTGEVNVFTTSGQALVIGSLDSTLSIGNDNGDPNRLTVLIGTDVAADTDISNQLSGGSLVGLLEFRNTLLSTAENRLGRIAVATAEAFNRLQSQGLDLNGELGANLFQPLTGADGVALVYDDGAVGEASAVLLPQDAFPRVYEPGSNSVTAEAAVTITDAAALAGGDLRIDVVDNAGTLNYSITRLSDGADLTAADPSDPAITLAGLSIDISNAADGDSFTIVPEPAARRPADYSIRVTDDGSGGITYAVERLSDGVDIVATLAFGDATDPSDADRLVFEGIEVSIESAAVGDRFTVVPYRGASGTFQLRLRDPEGLAAAAPVRAVADSANAGDAALTGLQISGTGGLPLGSTSAVDLRFDAANNRFDVFVGGVDSGADLDYDPASEGDGKRFTLSLAGIDAFEFDISGLPQDGDSFSLIDGAAGDNSNALAMETLRFDPLVGGTANLFEAYGQMVSDVGARVRQARIGAEAQTARLDAAVSNRQSIVGVNLEEEAANLLQLQQAFEAAAQIISVANQTFRSILDAVRS